MPAELVTLSELQDFLGDRSDGSAPILKRLLAGVKAEFERQCDRSRAPFQDAQAGRIEVHPGTGSALLMLDYPIASLTSVKLGLDPAAPAETLSLLPTTLAFGVGERSIERVDGGVFGEYGRPRYVHVTYNAAADLPHDVAILVMREVARVFRQRGSEDTTQEMVSGYSRSMAMNPVWSVADIDRHRRGVFL